MREKADDASAKRRRRSTTSRAVRPGGAPDGPSRRDCRRGTDALALGLAGALPRCPDLCDDRLPVSVHLARQRIPENAPGRLLERAAQVPAAFRELREDLPDRT